MVASGGTHVAGVCCCASGGRAASVGRTCSHPVLRRLTASATGLSRCGLRCPSWARRGSLLIQCAGPRATKSKA